jgi:sterol desaturase/sphingolipid hydroxylase (fatty acid hydroxylase superfamily)
MLERLATTAGVFVVLFVAFGPLERAFPARPEQAVFRREWRLDFLFFLGQYLIWNALAIVVLWGVRDGIAQIEPISVTAFIEQLPLGWRVLGGLVAGDFLVYWFHRASHRFEVLWRFHAVHHSAEQLDWLAAHREHPIDGLLTQICQNLPFFALGVRMDAIGALVVFRGASALFVHSNVRLSLGPFRWVVGAPELHHWHHARVETTKHNFANLAPWLDLLFDTHHEPDPSQTFELGNPEPDPRPRTYPAMMVTPFLQAKSPKSRT